jgi:hypothetical protein
MRRCFLLPTLAFSLFLAGCTVPASIGQNSAGNISVTGGISGKGKTAEGKDFDYDLHGTWTPTAGGK